MLSAHEPVWRLARRLHRSESSVRAKFVKLNLAIARDALTVRKIRRALYALAPPSIG